MSKKICLTAVQTRQLNVIKEYHQKHGTFPTPGQFVKAANAVGVKANQHSARSIYGTLFLKGAFTGGIALSDSAAILHSGGNVQPLDVSDLTFAPKTLSRGRPAGSQNKPRAAANAKQDAKVAVAKALLALLQQDKDISESLSVILGG